MVQDYGTLRLPHMIGAARPFHSSSCALSCRFAECTMKNIMLCYSLCYSRRWSSSPQSFNFKLSNKCLFVCHVHKLHVQGLQSITHAFAWQMHKTCEAKCDESSYSLSIASQLVLVKGRSTRLSAQIFAQNHTSTPFLLV